MPDDAGARSLEQRVYKCAVDFEANLQARQEITQGSRAVVFRTIWNHNGYHEAVAESRERIERSRLLLYLTKQLLRLNQRDATGVVSAAPVVVEERAVNRATILEHLALAEEHIQKGARIITRQQEIIEELDHDGHDTVEARKMLKNFEDAQDEPRRAGSD